MTYTASSCSLSCSIPLFLLTAGWSWFPSFTNSPNSLNTIALLMNFPTEMHIAQGKGDAKSYIVPVPRLEALLLVWTRLKLPPDPYSNQHPICIIR